MSRNTPTIRLFAVASALLLLGGGSGVVVADHLQSTPTYTGCLSSRNGQLYNLDPGDEPLRHCRPGDVTVHLSGGDITAVDAGDGLTATGGGSGDVSLSADYAALDERYRAVSDPVDADTLDGRDSTEFADTAHVHDGDYVNEGQPDSVTGDMILGGHGSGVDADTIDGLDSSTFSQASHRHEEYRTEPGISDYQIVRNTRTYSGDERFDFIVQTAICPPRSEVLGGGGFVGVRNKHVDSMRPIYPDLDPGTGYGWRVSFLIDGKIGFDFDVTVYAICADIESA